jgi:4-amino-4-deoxy-L-arabinose transferase-like glycosyltransferase
MSRQAIILMVMFGWRPRKSRLEVARIVVGVSLVAAVIFGFYFWRLGTLTQGLGPAEVNARSSSSSLQLIADNPVYAPHKILQYTVAKIFGHGALALRSVSVVLAILFLLCFYQLVKGWFGKMIGLFATLFLAATPWFILLARAGGPEIILLAPIAVLSTYYWLIKSRSGFAWLALLVSSGLVIYLPGGLLLSVLGAVFAGKNLKKATKDLGLRYKIIGVLGLLVILAPLVYAVSKNPSALNPLLLIPAVWPTTIVSIKSVIWHILALFWRTPVHADYIIGRLPMFSGAQVALALFGGVALLRLARTKLYLLLGMVAFGVLAAGFNRNLALLTFTLPAVSLAVASGLRYLYMEWRSVFPKNPLPKYLALALIALLVAIHVFYGLRYSLVAWPSSAATRSTYVLK